MNCERLCHPGVETPSSSHIRLPLRPYAILSPPVSAARQEMCISRLNSPPGLPNSVPRQKRRAVVQPGRTLAWGARGREFESRQPDHIISRLCGDEEGEHPSKPKPKPCAQGIICDLGCPRQSDQHTKSESAMQHLQPMMHQTSNAGPSSDGAGSSQFPIALSGLHLRKPPCLRAILLKDLEHPGG